MRRALDIVVRCTREFALSTCNAQVGSGNVNVWLSMGGSAQFPSIYYGCTSKDELQSRKMLWNVNATTRDYPFQKRDVSVQDRKFRLASLSTFHKLLLINS